MKIRNLKLRLRLVKLVSAVVSVVALAMIFSMFWYSCEYTPTSKYHKSDTTKIWLNYFKTTGALWSDTSAWAIKWRYDTADIKSDTDKDGKIITSRTNWHRDSLYFVPYDSLMVDPRDTSEVKSKKRRIIMLPLPRGWDLMEFKKTEVPLTSRLVQ